MLLVTLLASRISNKLANYDNDVNLSQVDLFSDNNSNEFQRILQNINVSTKFIDHESGCTIYWEKTGIIVQLWLFICNLVSFLSKIMLFWVPFVQKVFVSEEISKPLIIELAFEKWKTIRLISKYKESLSEQQSENVKNPVLSYYIKL